MQCARAAGLVRATDFLLANGYSRGPIAGGNTGWNSAACRSGPDRWVPGRATSADGAPMVTDHTAHPGILAGAPAPDRRAFPHPGSVPRWFEPFHVRQPQVARGEVTAQVVAGADIVVAPAWLTHRRTLEAVGESRRAREWTMAAVRMTREGVEAGLERRGGPGPVLVAGPLPDVAAGPEHATGRRLPVPASAERDTHDQAGILADAGVDLVLLEGRSSFEAARLATETTADTGRPTWTTIPIADAKGTPPLLERIAVLVASGAAGVLLEMDGTPDTARVTGALAAAADTTTVPVGLVTGTSAGLGTDDQLDAGSRPEPVSWGSQPGPTRMRSRRWWRPATASWARCGSARRPSVRRSRHGSVMRRAVRRVAGRCGWERGRPTCRRGSTGRSWRHPTTPSGHCRRERSGSSCASRTWRRRCSPGRSRKAASWRSRRRTGGGSIPSTRSGAPISGSRTQRPPRMAECGSSADARNAEPP